MSEKILSNFEEKKWPSKENVQCTCKRPADEHGKRGVQRKEVKLIVAKKFPKLPVLDISWWKLREERRRVNSYMRHWGQSLPAVYVVGLWSSEPITSPKLGRTNTSYRTVKMVIRKRKRN